MTLEESAILLAKEMVEHNLKQGATHLDAEYIAEQACEIAYKVHEKIKQYKPSA